MKTDSKTQQQQKAYFLYQQWIADELNVQWIPLSNLVMQVQPRATKNSLHEIFKAIVFKMYQKTSTTDLTKEELSSCIDVYMDALAMVGVNIEFPDEAKRNLLQFYS